MKTSHQPLRILTAVPICDGHDSTINTLNLEFVRHGIEVIYLGFHRSARDIVRAAIQEDVRAIGLSSYNGGHVEFFGEVIDLLREHRASEIGLFGGGGGTITADDAGMMRKKGVDRIFFAGTSLDEITQFVINTYGLKKRHRDGKSAFSSSSKRARGKGKEDDRAIARLLNSANGKMAPGRAHVFGFAGPGGAGKTTLIDELVLRFLNARPASSRLAILSHDPSIVGKGALLGDRATMIYSQNDRVFMHSLATRGRAGGLSAQTEQSLRALRALNFEWIFVETVGTGQEAIPFRNGQVNRSIFVMSPDYGSRLQLQKIVMLDAADIVVVNKSDLAGAKTAVAEIAQRLRGNGEEQELVSTVAKQHNDSGVNKLFEILCR